MTRAAHLPRGWPAKAARVGELLSPSRLHAVAWGRVQEELRARPQRSIAVAVSGGADSVGLLLLLWAHLPEQRKRIAVLHFNHRLRGRAANADERFCHDACAALGVKFVSGRSIRPLKTASEATLRDLRHAFFAREMKRRRIRLLCLAHQQDDIAETMLMRITRGSGTSGLAAPRPVQAMSEGRLHVRPLLTLKKREVEASLRVAGVEWREDDSNAAEIYLRNRVRRSIVPSLARASGRDVGAAAALVRERLEEDDSALESWLDEIAPVTRRPAALDLRKLAGKPRALWRRALHRWIGFALVDTDLSRAGFELLLEAVMRGSDTRFSLGARAFAVIRRGVLGLERR